MSHSTGPPTPSLCFPCALNYLVVTQLRWVLYEHGHAAVTSFVPEHITAQKNPSLALLQKPFLKRKQ